MRIGYGWDSHEFKAGIPCKIGGVELPHDKGLAGHSDGDVLLHALTDALLGAVAAGDIGTYFPPSDPKWKGANSVVFLEEAMRHIESAGYRVVNADTTLILAGVQIMPRSRMPSCSSRRNKQIARCKSVALSRCTTTRAVRFAFA